MHLETFAHGQSLLHRLDPRGKLGVALGFSLVVGLSQMRALAWVGLGLGVLAVTVARLPLRELLKRLMVVNGFVVLLWAMVPWTWGERGPAWDAEGLDLTIMITLKTNAVVLVLLGLVSTSPINHLFHALAHWKAPEKLVHLFLFFYRYLHVLHREYHRLQWALKVRGFRPRTDMHTWRTYAWLVGMLLVRSFDRAQRVYQAMLCRGFTGTLWLLDHFEWRSRDRNFVAGSSLVLAAMALWGVLG
jgi:cobalt/nickel transport system permease protein